MLLRIIVWGVLFFLVAPIVVIVLFSFHATPSLSFPFQGVSLRWYREVFEDPLIGAAVLESLEIATVTAIVTLLLGGTASLAWLRSKGIGRGVIEAISITPIALPGLFIGLSLLAFFAQIEMQLSMMTIVIAHVVLALPIMMIAMKARLTLFDPALEEAARDLGATPLQTFRRVTLRLMAPTLISSAILAFAVSFDEIVVTSFVAGAETTLPMYVWSAMRRTVTPLINAISTLALAFSIVILLGGLLVGHISRRSIVAARSDAVGE
jgi:spermidine/putrescine transport system permease protein